MKKMDAVGLPRGENRTFSPTRGRGGSRERIENRKEQTPIGNFHPRTDKIRVASGRGEDGILALT